MGRCRFPPAKTECLTAWWSVWGHVSPDGSSRSRARSIRSRRAARDAAAPRGETSVRLAIVLGRSSGVERRGRPLLGRFLQDDLDGLLDLLELVIAEARELHPLPEERQLAIEPALLPLELGDDL